jgi:DNA-binding transcriptional regulator YdaS (Cro superfamily)
MSVKALKRAVKIAGGQTALGNLIGKDQGTVWAWLNITKKVPPEFVIPIENTTGVSRHELRPDIYPAEVNQ